MHQLVLRDMTAQDIAAARELSREQKWPHRTSDWTFMFRQGRGLVAEWNGKIVGTTMCWQYGEQFATIGMVIVSSRCQSQGIGGKLMARMLDTLAGRTVMLNATSEALNLYTKLGFERTGVILQHQGNPSPMPLPELRRNERVRPMGARDDQKIGELDLRASGMDRTEMISSLLKASKAVILDRETEPTGFALFRRFGRGHSVGPLIAPDLMGAKALASHWLGLQAGKFCRLDVPSKCGLSGWLEDVGLPCVGEVTTMVRGTPPPHNTGCNIYSLISQALG